MLVVVGRELFDPFAVALAVHHREAGWPTAVPVQVDHPAIERAVVGAEAESDQRAVVQVSGPLFEDRSTVCDRLDPGDGRSGVLPRATLQLLVRHVPLPQPEVELSIGVLREQDGLADRGCRRRGRRVRFGATTQSRRKDQ